MKDKPVKMRYVGTMARFSIPEIGVLNHARGEDFLAPKSFEDETMNGRQKKNFELVSGKPATRSGKVGED